MVSSLPEDTLRKMWEDDYNGVIADNLYNDLNDPVDEENCWFEEDMAMITWQDGDTKEYYMIDVEDANSMNLNTLDLFCCSFSI